MEIEEKTEDETNEVISAIKSYEKLDNFLQKFLLGEIGYLIFFIGTALVLRLLPRSLGLSPRWSFGISQIIFIVIVIAGLLAVAGNISLSLFSLYYHIKSKHQGYPGTGHLLNWIFVIANAWIIILAVVLLTSRGFID